MSNTFIGLTDLIKLNDLNARDNGISDLLNNAPVMQILCATTASNGTQHHYIKQTTAPTVSFRAVNTGKDNSASAYTEIDITLKNLDASFMVDLAVADGYRFGREAFVNREARNAIKQAFFVFEKQLFYGAASPGDTAGFTGLGDNTGYDGLADALVVNAAGTTAATASSAWLIRTTPDETGLAAVIGNEGNIKIGDPVITLKADDSTATKSYGVIYTPIQAFAALQIGGLYSAVRICNLTADSGKGMTDALVATALALFPAGAGPTHLIMNRRSQAQLQKSRTATNATGAPAPFPVDSFGVPIVITDALLNTEALVA